MFDLINGIPLHPLVVHAIVVLLPLAVIGTIVIAFVPRWRVRYGVLVVACTAAATVLLPVATSSGTALSGRVGNPGEHSELGDQLILFAIPLFLLVAALVWLQWRRDRSARATLAADTPTAAPGATPETSAAETGPTQRPPVGGPALMVVAVLAVVVALANGVQVYRVGDSGAKAVWSSRISATR